MIGAFFVFSGAGKLIEPYQNFLYVVQNYSIFPMALENVTAHVVPWIEFFLGIFLALGLWTRWMLRLMLVLLSGFILIVGQAIVRKLPIDKCGCFGESITVPLEGVLLFDSVLWIIVVLMLLKQTSYALSLDNYFAKHNES